MPKYIQILSVYISRMLIYKVRALVWVLNDAAAIFLLPLVWIAAYGEMSVIGGLSKQALTTYYIVVGFVFVFVTPHPEEKMIMEIKDGSMSSWLVRPYSYFRHFFNEFLAHHFGIKLMLLFPLTAFAAFLYRDYLLAAGIVPLLLAFLAAHIAIVGFFCISFSVGCSAFWFEDAWAVQQLYWFCVLLFGGALAPLELLPAVVQNAARVLPFQYFHYFPAKLYLNQLNTGEIVRGFAMLGVWLLAGMCLYKLVWHYGTKRYSAIGG